MRTYELVLVLKSGLKDADRKKVLDGIKSWLGKVKFSKEEEMGQKPLSYPIKKEASGFFQSFVFEADTIPGDLEKRILNEGEVLRHLLIRQK